jgi:hypothetical protein
METEEPNLCGRHILGERGNLVATGGKVVEHYKVVHRIGHGALQAIESEGKLGDVAVLAAYTGVGFLPRRERQIWFTMYVTARFLLREASGKMRAAHSGVALAWVADLALDGAWVCSAI